MKKVLKFLRVLLACVLRKIASESIITRKDKTLSGSSDHDEER